MKIYTCIFLSLNLLVFQALAQEKLKGRVVDAQTQQPLPSAVITIKATKQTAITDNEGFFECNLVMGKHILEVQYLSYSTQQIEVTVPLKVPLRIELVANSNDLQEVQVVSTGYQRLAKERSTGAFATVDNALLNRTVSTNLLDRLDGVVNGLIFTKPSNLTRNRSTIEIRGRSTLFSSAEPLIILDNFPYDGDLANINPNDVENVTVLKDAAAASLWGARAGNGVIVITTKKGRLNMEPRITISSNVNIGAKPNLFDAQQLSSAQYIEVERFLFDKGAYNPLINTGYAALSPAVEILLARRNGVLSASEEMEQLNVLASYDVRKQIDAYYYRPSINQQYQANVAGGGAMQRYYFSAGFDNNRPNEVGSSYNRLTLNAGNTYYLLKNHLELTTGITYTRSKNTAGQGNGNLIYPYSRLADSDGNALVVANILRPAYAINAGNGKLLDWTYRPLEELNNGYNTNKTAVEDYRLNLALKYNIINGLSATGYLNYQNGASESNRLNELESFYTRNLINQFTQINATTGALTYPIPVGSILAMSTATNQSTNGRLQLDYNRSWKKQVLELLGGTEIRDYRSINNTNTFFGYNSDTKTNQNIAVNTTVNFPYFYNNSATQIVINPTQLETTSRFLSYYFTGSYTFDQRYIGSLSARKDESNIFGVASNQKGVPLWSVGLAWNINKEAFYQLDWLPKLKLRSTFGYTGNVNNSIAAYLTAVAGGSQTYNTYNARIVNPPNPSLRWEKNQNLNLALDFATKGNRISGSLDYWSKKGSDLIGNSPIAPQTGIVLFTGNAANTFTKGVDVEVNTSNLTGEFKWFTNVIYNHATSVVTAYKVSNGSNYNVVAANYNNPLAGYPYFAVFSFKYEGLNNLGNPLGNVNGSTSTDYNAIRNATNREDLVYHGAAVPTHFGNLRNTFAYQGFELSFNISYKLGYYFRRPSLDNGSLYSTGGNYKEPDYEKRWKNPGDELTTNVPALIYPSNTARNSIYTYGQSLVEKADHIRLRDIRLQYALQKTNKLPFQKLSLFTAVYNLGIIWRTNKYQLDPDYITGLRASRTIAFGFKMEL